MLRSAALELATSFRLAVEMVVQTDDVPMHIQGFPRGCCGIISELMGDYLNTVGLGEFFYVCGMKDGASHAWLEVDGLIVDITGDQFPDRPSIMPTHQTLGTASGRRTLSTWQFMNPPHSSMVKSADS